MFCLGAAALAGALVMHSVQSPFTAINEAAVPASALASSADSSVHAAPLPPVLRAGVQNPSNPSAPASPCQQCGVVEAVNAIREKGHATGLGGVAGGVLGGILGHQTGAGRGKTAMTVLGAIGGGLAGNEVEKQVRARTVFNVQVRMANGLVRTFRVRQALAVGTRVVVQGSTLRAA